MMSSINPLENLLSSSSSLSSSMSFTELINTTCQQPPSPESDLPPLQKLPPVTNFDSISPDLNDDEWLCSLMLGKEDDGGEEMDSQVMVSSRLKGPPPGIVSRLEDTVQVQEPNVSPMEEEEVGVKTTHSCSADTVLREFRIADVEDELVESRNREIREHNGQFEDLVNKLLKEINNPEHPSLGEQEINTPQSKIIKYSDDTELREFRIEDVEDELDASLCNKKRKRETHNELKGHFEDLVNKSTKKQEDKYKVLLDKIEQKERDKGKRKEEETRHQHTHPYLGQQEINPPQPTRQQVINIPQSSEINVRDQSGQEKQSYKKWPKHEIEALISLRMAVEKIRTGSAKYRMWEEISLGMASMGFTRTAKHCQVKWDRMTRCFKKAEGSGKTRAENAKTCPYFQELDTFYKKQRLDASYKRWTKHETQALISLKMAIDQKIPMLWEDISRAMASTGFTTTASQCICKWNNMTRCFKKAEGSGKTLAEKAKTCPYFEELDMMYKKGLFSIKKTPEAETVTS